MLQFYIQFVEKIQLKEAQIFASTCFPIKMPSFERFRLAKQSKTAIPCGSHNNDRIQKTVT